MKKLTRREFVAGALAGAAAAAGGLTVARKASAAIKPAAKLPDGAAAWIKLPKGPLRDAEYLAFHGPQKYLHGAGRPSVFQTRPLKLPPGMEVKNFHDLFCYTDIALWSAACDLNDIRLINPDGASQGQVACGRMFNLPFEPNAGQRGELTNEIDRNFRLSEEALVRQLYLAYLDFQAYLLRTQQRGRFVLRLPHQDVNLQLQTLDKENPDKTRVLTSLRSSVDYYLVSELPEEAEWPMQLRPVPATRPWHDVYTYFSCSRVFDRHQQFVRDITKLVKAEFV